MTFAVTATQSGTGTEAGLALTVKVLTGAGGTGAAASSVTVTTAELAITPQATGSWVYGAVANGGATGTFTAAGNTTFSQNQYYSADTTAFGTFRSTGTTTIGTPVTLGSTTTGTTGSLGIALCEILAAGTLAEDASSPATAYTTAATTLATATFGPPAGSLLVAMVSSNFSGTTNQSMTMAVSGGGLTWTRRSTGTFTAGTGSFQSVTVWTAQVPASPPSAPSLVPPAPFTPMRFRGASAPAPVIPQTYYVSPSGSDSSTGTSSGSPWQTITKVNATALNPGDTVLFQGGQTFSGTMLQPVQGGTATQPVTFGSYGTGSATITTSASTAIYVYEAGGIVIENLTITGPGAVASRTGGYVGVYFNRDVAGYAAPVTVTGCTITGWSDGILVGASLAGGGYSGVTITNNSVSANLNDGINLYGAGYSHQNVTITGNAAFNQVGDSTNTTTSSGHGIVVGNTDNTSGGVVAYNTAYGNGASCGCTGAGPVGIWTYGSKAVVIEYNASYQNKTQGTAYADGDGFDLDDDCVSCTLQYNIAYENDGAGIACYSDDTGVWSGNTIRYNITWQNSATNPNEAEIMFLGLGGGSAGQFANTNVYGNTFIGQTNTELPSVVLLYGAAFSSVNFWNNIFYTPASGVSLIYTDTAYTGVTFQGNLWYSAAPFGISWGGTNYTSLAAWRTATGQEKVSGVNSGVQANPALAAPGTVPAVTNPLNLAPAQGLYLTSGSPAATGAGLNLQSLFGVNPGTADFFGTALPASLPIGASATVSAPAIPPPLVPPAPFSPMNFRRQARPSGTPAASVVTGSDTGTGSGAGADPYLDTYLGVYGEITATAAPSPVASFPLTPPGISSPMAFQRHAFPSPAPTLTSSGDTGAGTETSQLTVAGSDSGMGADAAAVQVSSTDAGTGTEQGGVPGASFPLTPPGFTSPMAWRSQAWPSGAPQQVVAADTGTAADGATATPANAPPPPASAVAIPPGPFTPMAWQRQAWPSGAPVLTLTADAGGGTDAATVTIPAADTGTGTEGATLQVSDTDAGTGTEGGTVGVSGTDTGAGAETGGRAGASFPVIPPGFASPMAWQRQAFPAPAPAEATAQDAGTGAEAGTVTLTGTDTGAGTEAATVQIPGADTATGTDTATVQVTSADTGAGTELSIAATFPPPVPLTPPGRLSPMAWQYRTWGAPVPPRVGGTGIDTGGGTDTAVLQVADIDTGTLADTSAPTPVTGTGVVQWLNPVRESMTGLDVTLYMSQALGGILQFANTGSERLYLLAGSPGVTVSAGPSSMVLTQDPEQFTPVLLTAGMLYAFGPFHSVLQTPGSPVIEVTLNTAYGVQVVVVQGPDAH